MLGRCISNRIVSAVRRSASRKNSFLNHAVPIEGGGRPRRRAGDGSAGAFGEPRRAGRYPAKRRTFHSLRLSEGRSPVSRRLAARGNRACARYTGARLTMRWRVSAKAAAEMTRCICPGLAFGVVFSMRRYQIRFGANILLRPKRGKDQHVRRQDSHLQGMRQRNLYSLPASRSFTPLRASRTSRRDAKPAARTAKTPQSRSVEMYTAVCAACGKEATVPFKPREDRPCLLQ